ncbi:MAG: hypothetical protein U0793_30290 [Gemmataceae bacterium]
MRPFAALATCLLLLASHAAPAEVTSPWEGAELVAFKDFDDLEIKLAGQARPAFLVGLRPLHDAVKDKKERAALVKDVDARLRRNALSARVVTRQGDRVGLSLDTFMHHKHDFNHLWDPAAYPYCWSGWGAYNFNSYFLFNKTTTFLDNFGTNAIYRESFGRALKAIEAKAK